MPAIHTLIASLCAILLFVNPALAQDAAPIQAHEAYAYPPIGASKAGVAFMHIHNPSSTDYSIKSVTSEAFARVEMHTHLHEDGIMKMRKIDAIDLPAGQTVALQSGGLHLMLYDAAKPIAVGDNLAINLQYAPKAPTEALAAFIANGAMQTIKVEVPVRARTSNPAQAEEQDKSAHHHH